MTKPSPPRRRDAAASRDRLLRAAGELFAERGFDRTTAREIGERADVDPAMIARYFGGKVQLFIACLRAERESTPLADLLDPTRLGSLLDRTTRQGPSPIVQAAVRPYDDDAAQVAARAELDARLLTPLRQRLAAEGDDQAPLRAEFMTAALIGVLLARSAGTLEHLGAASTTELLPLLQSLLGSCRAFPTPDGHDDEK
jgi:AcrR family transcriptional regulator